jgi:hypothetical protein
MSSLHSVGLFWVPRYSRVRGNENVEEGTVDQFAGPELALGVSRQNIRKNIKCWMDKQHVEMWWGLVTTQRQA